MSFRADTIYIHETVSGILNNIIFGIDAVHLYT
jgi:hypothetical protein